MDMHKHKHKHIHTHILWLCFWLNRISIVWINFSTVVQCLGAYFYKFSTRREKNVFSLLGRCILAAQNFRENKHIRVWTEVIFYEPFSCLSEQWHFVHYQFSLWTMFFTHFTFFVRDKFTRKHPLIVQFGCCCVRCTWTNI